MEEVHTPYSFYPRKDDPCPNVRWCPHAGSVGISTLVVLANENDQAQDHLHRALDAERKPLSESVAENEKPRTELVQVKLELKLERQNKFATNQKKQANPTPQPDPEPEKPKGKRGAPVGHPGWFRPMPTHYDWAVDVPAPRRCPHCQGSVDILSSTEPSHHLQKDIIDGVYRVVLFRHAACRCGQCDRLVEQPGKNEILLSRIGPFLRSKAAYLRNMIGISYRKVPLHLREPELSKSCSVSASVLRRSLDLKPSLPRSRLPWSMTLPRSSAAVRVPFMPTKPTGRLMVIAPISGFMATKSSFIFSSTRLALAKCRETF